MSQEVRDQVDEDGCKIVWIYCQKCHDPIYIGDLFDGDEILCYKHDGKEELRNSIKIQSCEFGTHLQCNNYFCVCVCHRYLGFKKK